MSTTYKSSLKPGPQFTTLALTSFVTLGELCDLLGHPFPFVKNGDYNSTYIMKLLQKLEELLHVNIQCSACHLSV